MPEPTSRPSAGELIGALDQGTTSTRFILFDRAGNIVASAQKEHTQIYPQAGWVEHDAREILANTLAVIDQAVTNANVRSSQIAAIGITNQRETTVVWDRATGEPIYNAIVWQDTRVAAAVQRLTHEGGQDRFRAQTGLPLSTYFSALKIAWILDNVEGARRRAEAGELLFGNIDSYLLWNLTNPQSPRHRCDQRRPDPADGSRHARLVRGAARRVQHPRRHAARDPLQRRTLRRSHQHRALGRAHLLHARRPARRPRRPDLLHAWPAQEHLRHRLFPVDEYRRKTNAFEIRDC